MSVNIDSIKRRMLVKYPSFGSIVANAKIVEDASMKTAATDGEFIYYNPSFMESLTSDEQVFLFAHEVCHIAFDHIFRREGKNKKLWNIATDAVINAFLQQDGLPLIEGGVDRSGAINYNAEDLYNELLKEYEENNDNQNSNSSNGDSNSESDDSSSDNDNVGHDDHDIWDEAIEKKKQQEKDTGNDKEEKDDKKNDDNKSNGESDKKKDDDVKKLSEQGEKKSFDENKKERKKQLKELQDSLIRESHGAGNDTNSNYRQINDIGYSKPLIDWRMLLREAVKYDVDWSYQNATIEEGVVTPHLEEYPEPETEIVLDTSGSIDENLLRNFLRECKNILQTSKVKVGCFDTKFYGFNEIRNEKDIDEVPLQGGGGTNFDVAVGAFSRRVENKIIFTDGEASMPKMPIDAIWVVFGDRKINPQGGKVIYISYEELRKLSSNSYGGRSR